MKYLLLLLLSLTSSFAEVSLEISDDPRDRDSYLWNVTGKHGKDEVVVFSFQRTVRNQKGETISDDTYYTIKTGVEGSANMKIIAVNPDYFRKIKEENATWCLVYNFEKFYAKGKSLALLARGETGQIKIGTFEGNTTEFTFNATTMKAKDALKKFKLGDDMLGAFSTPNFSMMIRPKNEAKP